MERKYCEFEYRSAGGGGVLEGYASVKGVVDSYGDVVADGAYRNLDRFVSEGFVSIGHAHGQTPIGLIEAAKEDERGLWVRMRFHSTPEAQAARTVASERMGAGKTVGLSIGYIANDWSFEERDGRRVRVLTSVDVKEFSIVTLPAARDAVVTGVKSEFDIVLAVKSVLGLSGCCLDESDRAGLESLRAACSEVLGDGADDVAAEDLAVEWRQHSVR